VFLKCIEAMLGNCFSIDLAISRRRFELIHDVCVRVKTFELICTAN
jgi:hypothetical protein